MMSDEKILHVLDLYERGCKLRFMMIRAGDDFQDHPELHHILTMIPQMREFLREGRREKLMRWLGFIQGILYTLRLFTIEELKEHNRPDEAE